MLPNTVHYVVYNGIQINLTKIDSFDSVAEQDDSGVDRIWNHVTIRVKGIANSQVNIDGLGNAALLTYLRSSLQEPRRPLAVYINGIATINVDGPDANNGPITRDVKVYDMMGATIMVEFVVEYWQPACSSTQIIVVSNRWKQKTEIDKDGYTTLTSSGKLIVDPSKQPYQTNADSYRNVIYPVFYLPAGFERESQSFEVSEDGQTLEWSVVDQQKYLVSPTYTDSNGMAQVITKWEGEWREESGMDKGGGAMIIGTLTVKAWGQRNVAKNMLLLFCLRVFQSRWNQERDVIQNYAFVEGLSENSVALNVSVMTWSSKDITQTKLAFQSTTTRIGTPLYIYQSGQPQSRISSRGNAGLWIVVKDIVATCSDKTTRTVITSNTSNQTPEIQGQDTPVGVYTIAESNNDVEQTRTPYTLSHIETQVVESQNVIPLGRASASTNADSFNPRMSTPTSRVIVRYHMERLNASPQLPSSVLTGRVLLRNVVTMSDAMLLPSGVDRIYVIKGEMMLSYVETAQIGTEPIFMPAAITDAKRNNGESGVPSQRTIGQSSFTGGLIDVA